MPQLCKTVFVLSAVSVLVANGRRQVLKSSLTTKESSNETSSSGFNWPGALRASGRSWNQGNWLRFGSYDSDGMRMRQAAGTYCCWLESALEGLNHQGYIYAMFDSGLVSFNGNGHQISWQTPNGQRHQNYGSPQGSFSPWKGKSPEWPTQAKWQQILMNVVYFPATELKSAQGMEKEDCPAAMGFGPEGTPDRNGRMQGRAPRLEERLRNIDNNIRVYGEHIELGKKTRTKARDIRNFIRTQDGPGTATVFTLDKVNKGGRSGHAIAVDRIIDNPDYDDAWLFTTYNQYKDEYSQYPSGEFSIAENECVSSESSTKCSDLYKYTITGLPQVPRV